MRSLYSGVSGLQVHQTKMDVIANNISNVNTVGYKSSRVTFSDFFSQSVSGASSASDASGRGGTNPMQIGLGANLGSIDMNMSSGMGQRTDNNFDLMIEGSGFFIVGDDSGKYFTRAGAFSQDSYGNLVTSDGLKVYGWDVDDEGNPIREAVQPIQISGDKTYSPPQKTTDVSLVGNLNASETGEEVNTTMRVFDSLGNYYTIDVKYTYDEEATAASTTGEAVWNMSIGDRAYPNGERDDAVPISYADGEIVLNDSSMTDFDTEDDVAFTEMGDLTFSSAGYLTSTTAGTALPDGELPAASTDIVRNITISVDTPTNPPSEFGDGDNEVKLDFTDMTQFNATTDATTETMNGYAAGSLNELNVGTDGSIVATYSNGETRTIFQIPVANFTNPAGLSKVGGNLFQQTINSGTFDGIGVDVTASGGTMSGGMLEMSNVDLSSEFTEMITTQRGYQANSRTITTSDEMLQELINLKR